MPKVSQKMFGYMALASLILCTFFAVFTPMKSLQTEINWSPKLSSDSGDLILYRGWPSKLKISIVADSIPPKESLILDIGSWKIQNIDQTIQIKLNNLALIRSDRISKNDLVRIGFDADTGRLTLNNKELFISTNQYPIVSKLSFFQGSSFSINQLSITTRDSQLSNQPRVYFLIGILFLWVLYIKFKFRYVVSGKFFSTLRAILSIYKLGSTVQIPLFIAAVLVPAFPDDGWVLTRSSFFFSRGFLGNIYTSSDAPMPQGFLIELVYAILQEVGFSLISFRLFISILLTLSWGVIKRMQFNAGTTKLDSIFPSTIFILFSVCFLMTVRAEIWVYCLSLFAFFNLNRSESKIEKTSFLLAITLGLGISTHQTGFILLGPVLAHVICTVKNRYHFFLWVKGVLLSLPLGSIFLFIGLDPAQAWIGANDFRSGGFHTRNELERYVQVFNYSSELRVLAVLLFLLLIVIGYAFIIDEFLLGRQKIDVRLLASIISPIFLFLTSSKWTWHFGSITLSVVLISFAIARKTFRGRFSYFYTISLAIMLCVLASFNFTGGWGFLDYGNLSWSKFGELTRIVTVFWFQILVLGIFLVVLLQLKKSKQSARIGTLLALVVAFPTLANASWMGADALIQFREAKTETWSPGYQNIKSLFKSEKCGLQDVMNSVGTFTPLRDTNPSSIMGSFSSREMHATNFQDIRDITLEDFTSDGVSIASRYFSIQPGSNLGIWYLWNGLTTGQYMVKFFDGSGEVLSSLPLVGSTAEVYNWISLDYPAGSERMELSARKLTPGDELITLPVKYEKLHNSGSGIKLEGFTSPYASTYFPCVLTSNPSLGFVQKANVFVPGIYQFDSGGLAQIGCIKSPDFCIYSAKYKLPENLDFELVKGGSSF
jgi:hypothetical protein